MIVGGGLLGSQFQNTFSKDSRVTIFASGVSDSTSEEESAFGRERTMLTQALQQEKLLIYFSSCCIYDPDQKQTAYTKHKLAMEALVKKSKRFLIFRLPQIVSSSNNQVTLANYIYGKISTNQHFSVWRNAFRNIIDVEDIRKIATTIILSSFHEKQFNRTLNIASTKMTSVVSLVQIFEHVLKSKALYTLIDKGSFFEIDTTDQKRVCYELNIRFTDTYERELINKYYGNRS